MAPFNRNLPRFFVVITVSSAIVYLVLNCDNTKWILQPSDRRIRTWTRADVLNNSKFPSPDVLPCDWKPEAWNKTTRSLCFLACDTTSDDGIHRNISSSALVCKQVTDSATSISVPSLSPEEVPCLKYFINQHCYGKGHTIPRVIHYIRFGTYQLTLEAFFGMYSSARFLQPCLILLHGKTVAPGPLWRMLLHLVPNIVHVQMDRPREIFGRKINVVQHSSDVARLHILLEYGGIYADFDQLFLHSFDDLLDKDTVLGNEFPNISINNALILTKPNAEFLRIWLSRYNTFNDRKWSEHSTRLPFLLYRQYPQLVHVVDTFYPPLSPDRRGLYSRKKVAHFNWATQHSVHLYTRDMFKFIYGKVRLDKQDNAMGDAVRYILHGNETACLESRVDKVSSGEGNKKDEKQVQKKEQKKKKKRRKGKKGKKG